MPFPPHKPNRLRAYDYSAPGTYFVTICTYQRNCCLCSISIENEASMPEVKLTVYGAAVKQQILDLQRRFPGASVDHYVIMPNHIHLLLTIHAQDISLSNVIGALKSLSDRSCRKCGYSERYFFQTSFYDHVVRNQQDYERIWNYIDGNPQRWKTDEYYV